MRCLILSDIHANLVAFEAVMADVKQRGLSYDIVWCLGDMVGYGPDPNECIELLKTLPHICLAGNHDWAVLGKLDLETFNDSAMAAIEWTRERLKPEHLRYLQVRPEKFEDGEYLLVHASPRKPIWEYIIDSNIAEENFPLLPSNYCLVGHTHVPLIFVKDGRTQAVHSNFPVAGMPVPLKKGSKYILNPGGIGQPRDGDPRAAYALLDTSTVMWMPYRVEYAVKNVQDKMRALNFPPKLIDRLEYGR
jgi:diadenosine tetraphosphatase ApaH/serine/threonine PP2A family protein phosphatase